MNLLITAGNTHAPIDRVRVLTNIFSGKTGASIARTAWARGHTITLATSHPETLSDLSNSANVDNRVRLLPYRTFDELAGIMQSEMKTGAYDVVCHSAAVSDYLSAGVFAPESGTFFNARVRRWETQTEAPSMVEHKGGKIKSSEPELWIRLVRAPKLVDRLRNPWGFQGILVKFKLEVGLTDQELIDVAEESRKQSQADLIVANTLEGSAYSAFIGPITGKYERIFRRELAERVLLAVEQIQRERS